MVSFSCHLGLFCMTLLALPSSMEGFVIGVSSGVQKQSTSKISVAADDMAGHASPLPLSASDLSRLTALKERHQTIPIMILESILPGQKIAFQSNDPTLAKLIAYTAQSGQEIGVLGFNPISGKPLSIGVTVPVTKDSTTIHVSSSSSSLTVQVQGNKRFEIQGQPYMDASETFFLANVELIDERPEPELSSEDEEVVMEISEQVPHLVEEWLELLLKKNHKNQEKIAKLLMEMGDMPETPTGRAIWIASLINPTQAFWKEKDICMEIRPAMLACRNDRDRMILAHAALVSSINRLQ